MASPPVTRPRLRRGWRTALALLLATFVLASCQGQRTAQPGPTTPSGKGAEAGKKADGDTAQGGNELEDDAGSSDGGSGGGGGKVKKACPEPQAERDVPPRKATVLDPGGDGRPRVEAAVYPHPQYEGRPWSQWGQGVAVAGGRFFSAIGDQCGINGNAYVYSFDAETSTLALVGDVLAATGHTPGAWGYGKIHAQLVPGPGGQVFAATYWGTHKGLAYGMGYEGDQLLRIDPGSGALTKLGVPLARHGIPSLSGWAEDGLLYGEAVDPGATEPGTGKKGAFFAYDVRDRRVVFRSDAPDHVGFRNVMVDGRGRAYFSAGGGRLQVYDPATRQLQLHPGRMPGDWLRASTRPAPDGTVYGVTREPDMAFALRPSGEIVTLGPVRGYVASIALAPDGSKLFYVPEAHGKSWEQGTPVIAVDTRTGKDEVVVALNEMAESRLGLRLGGSYNIAVDPGGDRLYVGLNAGGPADEDAFGEVVLAVVNLR